MELNSNNFKEAFAYAHKVSQLSTAKKRKVGALILQKDDDGNLIYICSGHNHRIGFDNCEDIDGETLPDVIHAEENAIMRMLTSSNIQEHINKSKPLIMVCTYAPCINCAKLMAQVGIKELYYMQKHETKFDMVPNSPKQFLERLGIEIYSIKEFMKNDLLEKLITGEF